MEDTVIRKNKFTLSREPKLLDCCESLTQRRSVSRVSLSREHKSMICCESLTQRTNVSRVSLIILISTIFGFTNIAVYAQTEIDSGQNQITEEMVDNTNETTQAELIEYFIVDNNTYKILKQDKNNDTVMLWECKMLDGTRSIIINNEVTYNGQKFKVKYIYEKAFYYISKNIENIIIDEKVLGFCDSSENVVEIIDETFKDQKELESVDFGNANFSFGRSCFQSCSLLLNIDLPINMNIMEEKCFDRCSSLKKIDLGGITKFNGQSSFSICRKLENIGEFNDEVIELPDRTFTSCSILKINSLNNITKLGVECFKSCRLLDKDIVTNVEEIGDNCFWGCNFSEVYLKKAKKVGYNAFGGIANLKKIRFGNPDVPFLEKNIAEGSSVNEWVYPLSYKTQPNYLEFLSKLKTSKVVWDHNYENLKREITQSVTLNSLIPPSITRDGYEIEGWYQEPECINKVKMIVDLGKIVDSDVVIKDPVLYAKWTAKEAITPEETKEPIDAEEVTASEETQELSDAEEPTTSKETKESIDTEETTTLEETQKLSDAKESTMPEEIKEPSDAEETTNQEEINNPSDFNDIENSNASSILKVQKENDYDNTEYENDKFSSMLYKPRKTKNSINGFTMKIKDENKDVNIKETKKLSLENEIIKNIFVPTSEKNDIKIKYFNWSYIDNINSDVKIIKSGALNKIIKNNQCIEIFLKSDDYFKNNTIIEMNIKNIMKPSKLYSYSEELGKFILINENLQINNDIIEIRPTNQKEYLITAFDLNENNVAIQGWNKVLPQQPNALLSKHINELSWVYLQGEELSKGWVKDFQEDNWYFMNQKGIMETGWLKYKDDKWYYLNTISNGSKGAMRIGWNKINNEWYYLQNDGVLAVNTIIDGYAVGYDGKLI